jgi:hypothetical protein
MFFQRICVYFRWFPAAEELASGILPALIESLEEILDEPVWMRSRGSAELP